jgi:hypothetical protein
MSCAVRHKIWVENKNCAFLFCPVRDRTFILPCFSTHISSLAGCTLTKKGSRRELPEAFYMIGYFLIIFQAHSSIFRADSPRISESKGYKPFRQVNEEQASLGQTRSYPS